MAQELEEIIEDLLEGHKISSFSKSWISKNRTATEETIRETYEFLKKIGLSNGKIATHAHLLVIDLDSIKRNYKILSDNLKLSDGKIATHAQLLSMNPDTIEKNYQRLHDLGLSKKSIATNAQLLGINPDTIERNYQRLHNLGLSDEKIATHAFLLGRNPKTIKKNYQNYIGLLRHDYKDRESGREILLQQAQLLGISPDTVEANVQWFADRRLDYGNGVLLGTKVQTKRKKLAWILREVFDYRNQQDKRETINRMYAFIADNPRLMIKSIKALERVKGKLIKKAEQYK